MARKILKGKVVKKSGDKTFKVLVERTMIHPRYKKVITVRKHFLVHSEEDLQIGQDVYIMASRRFSKLKHFVVVPEDKIEKIRSNA